MAWLWNIFSSWLCELVVNYFVARPGILVKMFEDLSLYYKGNEDLSVNGPPCRYRVLPSLASFASVKVVCLCVLCVSVVDIDFWESGLGENVCFRNWGGVLSQARRYDFPANPRCVSDWLSRGGIG